MSDDFGPDAEIRRGSVATVGPPIEVLASPPESSEDLGSPGPRDLGRETDLRLARLHLQLGLLALAWAELEAAQGDEPLDRDGLVDLAEARWRGGDLAGAGSAARAALDAGADAPIAAVIAIEAQPTIGAGGSVAAVPAPPALDSGVLDGIFAGMPRSAAWPPDPAVPHQVASESQDVGPQAPRTAIGPGRPAVDRGDDAAARTASGPRLAAGVRSSSRRWATSGSPLSGPAFLPNGPSAELDAAADDLAAGDEDAAAIRLAVLLRVEPATAPAVVELLQDAMGASLAIVRGDALRVLGRVAEAERAWASAAGTLVPSEPPETGPGASELSSVTAPDAAHRESPVGPDRHPAVTTEPEPAVTPEPDPAAAAEADRARPLAPETQPTQEEPS